jgi:hypothetical protein
MNKTMGQLVQQCTDWWWEGDDGEFSLEPRYTKHEQRENEAHLRHLLAVLNRERKRVPRNAEEALGARERIGGAAEALGRAVLQPDEGQLALLSSQVLVEAAIEFADRARRYDPKLRGEDVFQASRNAWVMFGIQLLTGQPVAVTQAIYGYSLLYPYTDNFLDHPAIPADAKALYVQRLTQRLADPGLAPTNVLEETVWKLVAMIEEQYHRGRYPQIYESLLAIHHAQGKSVDLIRAGASPNEVDVLGISLEKGGASVVADGYLVAPSLSEAQAEFFFGFGAYLQLVDDLQDVRLDRREKLRTVFTQEAAHGPLDQITNRTLRFGARVMEGLGAFDAPGTDPLKALMTRSTELLLVEAAGQAGRLYSRSYRRELESCSPLRFSALDRARGKLNRQREKLERLAEEILLFS